MRYKLKDIFDLQMGKTPSRNNIEYWNANDYKWISIADLTKTSKYISETKEYLSESAVGDSGIKVIPANTVVMSFKLSIGKTAITAENMYSNEAIMAFRDKHIVEILPEYIYYMFKYKNWDEGSNKAVMGKTLNKATLSEVEIEICSITEQRKIVSVLDKMSSALEKREDELSALDDLIKARFVELFDGKYPEDTLLNLCNIVDYRGKTPEKVEHGLPFITAKNVKMHHMTLEPREYISKETYDKVMVRGFPKEGDVVFTTEAPLGNVCRIPHFDTEFYIGQRIVTMQTDALNPTYLEYALSDEEFVRKYMGKSSGSTVTGIRVRLLEQLTIPVPPRTLQDEFATFVNQVDKSKVAVQKALDETQMLFDSLMQEYFG